MDSIELDLLVGLRWILRSVDSAELDFLASLHYVLSSVDSIELEFLLVCVEFQVQWTPQNWIFSLVCVALVSSLDSTKLNFFIGLT